MFSRFFPCHKANNNKTGDTMQAKTKEQYRKAWKSNINELAILAFSFSTNDLEFDQINEHIKGLKKIVDAAAEKLDLPEK